jgi:uncharacterized membrane protein YgcG
MNAAFSSENEWNPTEMEKSFNPVDRKAPCSRRSGFLEKAMGKRLSFLVIVAGLILSAQPLESQESPIARSDAYRAFLRAFYGRLERFAGLLLPSKLTFLADGGGGGGGDGGGGGSGDGSGSGTGGDSTGGG